MGLVWAKDICPGIVYMFKINEIESSAFKSVAFNKDNSLCMPK